MEKGIIFDIQRFCIHDGPGIRTVIFLKGCPLRCLWCSNPESQNNFPELMHNPHNCASCLKCVRLCPQKAISFREGKLIFNSKLCNYCGKCWQNCSYNGWELIGQWADVNEIMDLVRRDLPFYNRSGGGITLSGGEPLMQPDFCASLLQACQKEKIHVTVETCGYQSWEIFKYLLSMIDLVLFDIKVMDTELHRKFTGKDNDLILANAAQISSLKPLIIRIPIIPQHNDYYENIIQTAFFAKKIGAKELHLLPYHRLGESKYARMGRSYSLPNLIPPSKETLEKIYLVAAQANLPIQIGG